MKRLDYLRLQARSWQLGRELRQIEGRVSRMEGAPLRKLASAVIREIEHAQADAGAAGARDFSSSRRTAIERVRSCNLEVRICGISQWVGEAYRETAGSDVEALQAAHRRILRICRILREALESADQEKSTLQSYFGASKEAFAGT